MPRNVSGTYTLPLPPVVANTVIQAAWGNTTTEDLAQGITDSLDRQGRGGMIAPFRLTDGTVLQPAWAFSAETGTGMYRESAGVLSLAVMGVKVGQFAAAGFTGTLAGPFNITGAVAFTGTVAVTGAATFASNVSVAGRGLFADGTVALPSISFTSDPDTGIYKVGVGEMDFAADGVKKLSMNQSTVLVAPSPTASAPSSIIFAGINAGGPGYAIDILGSGVATDKAIVRWLNNSYTIERLSITTDSAAVVFGVPGALPMQFTTSNVTRLTIAAAGNATYTGDFRVTGSLAAAPNFWVGETAAGAGTVGISGGLGASTVYWGNSSLGAGAMTMVAAGATALTLQPAPGAVNYWQLQNAGPGVGLLVSAEGTDANINIGYVAKGTGAHTFYSGSTGAGLTQFAIQGVSGATRFLYVGGSAAANPTLTASAGLIQFGTSAVNVGGAAPPQSGVGTTLTYASSSGLGWITPGKTANNRVTELYNDSTAFYARWVDDAYTSGLPWLSVTGGQSAGTTGITFSLLGTLVISAVAPGPTSNGILHLSDTGGAGVNIKMTGDGGTTPKKYIRVTGGAFQILNDGYSAALLGIADDGVLTDTRGLAIARDVGATGGSTPPVGSFVIGSISPANVNALATFSAAAQTITVFASGSGSNTTITAGTWRVIGALSSSSNVCLLLRTA